MRVRGQVLEIVVSRSDLCRPVTRSCGVINLPIYVNPTSLRFFVDEATNLLHMVGEMKGCTSHGYADESDLCTTRRSTWSGERPEELRRDDTALGC